MCLSPRKLKIPFHMLDLLLETVDGFFRKSFEKFWRHVCKKFTGGHRIQISKVDIQARPLLAGGQQAIILRPGQQTVVLAGGQQVRQKVNTQPVLVNSAMPSARGHPIRVPTPSTQTRPLLVGGRNVIINHSGSQISVPLHALQSMQPG